MFANVHHVVVSTPPLQLLRCRPLELSPSGPKGFMFVTCGNAEVALWVFANHTIDQVKAEIEQLFGVPSHLQKHCYRHYPSQRRPSPLVIPLEENMMFVRHLFIHKSMMLKEGFSFNLIVTQQPVHEKTVVKPRSKPRSKPRTGPFYTEAVNAANAEGKGPAAKAKAKIKAKVKAKGKALKPKKDDDGQHAEDVHGEAKAKANAKAKEKGKATAKAKGTGRPKHLRPSPKRTVSQNRHCT